MFCRAEFKYLLTAVYKDDNNYFFSHRLGIYIENEGKKKNTGKLNETSPMPFFRGGAEKLQLKQKCKQTFDFVHFFNVTVLFNLA